ncbi:unnamed protein product [Prorocentrum cordatum]|uniref:Uncharacterized protein n=1 Tax=Prorocentrum cordatum TaxID=2364126 RepID=A0ABN9UMG7_9DINO|nr:unnamed protein product [Polarella glacialis]
MARAQGSMFTLTSLCLLVKAIASMGKQCCVPGGPGSAPLRSEAPICHEACQGRGQAAPPVEGAEPEPTCGRENTLAPERSESWVAARRDSKPRFKDLARSATAREATGVQSSEKGIGSSSAL